MNMLQRHITSSRAKTSGKRAEVHWPKKPNKHQNTCKKCCSPKVQLEQRCQQAASCEIAD